MAHQSYPTFDLDCVKDVIRIVRNRSVREEFALFAKCVYTLIGAGLAGTVGEPDLVEPSFGAAEVPDADLLECAAALQEYETTFGAEAAEGEKLDPATIALIIQLASMLLKAFLERRKQGS